MNWNREKPRGPIGYWWDVVYQQDPQTGLVRRLYQTRPRKNLMVQNSRLVSAGRYLNDAGFTGGILQMEVGQGNPAWDPITPPTPVISDSALVSPVARRTPAELVYLDGADNPTPSRTAKIRAKFLLDFGDSDVNGQTIREQALFGGDATATLGSGLMINVLRPPAVEKTPGIKIEKFVTLEFVL